MGALVVLCTLVLSLPASRLPNGRNQLKLVLSKALHDEYDKTEYVKLETT